MKRITLLLLAAALCITAALTISAPKASAQMGMGGMGFRRPNIANVFHPVVGAGAAYEQTDKDGKKSHIELSTVDKEMVGTDQGFWIEIGHARPGSEDLMYAKALMTATDFKVHKMVFVMPGSTQPMERDMDAAKGQRENMQERLDKWHSTGTESVTVPAGTFSCEHWVKDDGKGEAWINAKIAPLALVKSVDGGDTMVLVKVISDAKTHFAGTPVKFDPQMMQQMMQNRQKP